MKRKYIKKSCILIIIFVLSISGCGASQNQDKNKEIVLENENSSGGKERNEEDIIKVNLDYRIINISGKSVEETVEEIRGGGNCLDIYENVDGTVTIEITKEQQEYWLNSRGELLEDLQEKLKEYDENYRLEHNDSYTQVDAYYNLDLPADKAIVYVMYAEFLCASYQLFSGVDSDSWRVEINIYNSDTGKLVKSGSSDADFGYENSDWEASK
ncbi:hypothetical protein [Roseburia sp. 499]|uniref:hypothetical protein n=1 Tax=Roseburia sp. 499 TaxID=1261634 RepID=UPI0009524964|nr:hypothetical protein [Roseburia sp. 499]WVK70917.1 hypothetical protein BIV20_05125 [Roseburia sp. 499]